MDKLESYAACATPAMTCVQQRRMSRLLEAFRTDTTCIVQAERVKLLAGGVQLISVRILVDSKVAPFLNPTGTNTISSHAPGGGATEFFEPVASHVIGYDKPWDGRSTPCCTFYSTSSPRPGPSSWLSVVDTTSTRAGCTPSWHIGEIAGHTSQAGRTRHDVRTAFAGTGTEVVAVTPNARFRRLAGSRQPASVEAS